MNLTKFYAAIVAATLAGPAVASSSYNPTVGFGLTFTFSGGAGETGVGLRLFSSNERDKAAATVGVDYLLSSKRIRPSLGVAYLGSDSYIGADVGFGLNGEGLDFGLGLGAVNTKKEIEMDR